MTMRMLAATALVVVAALTGSAATAAGVVPGAVDPVADQESTSVVTIGQDGSYQVVLTQKVEMRASTYFAFGGTVHDGFRLPDDGSVLPPYLRAAYSAPEATLDGTPVASAFEVDDHAVSIAVGDDFDEGSHRGVIRYDVTNAAMPGDDEYVVYVRPLRVGTMSIAAADSITSVECVTIPPDAAACGQATDDGWLVGADEFGAAGVVKITLAGDASGIAPPDIDRS